jgi:hypothetical protein
MADAPAGDVCFYVGARRTGKTYLALRHLASRADGRPAVVVDSIGADNFASMAGRCDTIDAAIDRAWKQKLHTVVSPRTDDEGALLFDCAADLGGVHLLVDESARWITGRRSCASLEMLLRAGRHRRVSVALTTQHFSGDVPQWVFQVEPAFYLFRTRGRRALERLAEEFEDEGLPEQVAALEPRRYLLYPLELRPGEAPEAAAPGERSVS